MWKDSLSRVLCIALGTVMVSSPTIWSQEVPSVKRFRGGGRSFFKRVEVGASKVIRLSFEGVAEEDLIVIRSRGREMQIVGGVYHGPRIRRGALTPNAPLESLFPLQYAPLPEEVVHVNGTQVEFKRPATLSGIVFFDISVPERARVHLVVNGRSLLDAQVSELAFSKGQLGIGSKGVPETMWRAAFPETSEVVPLAAPGEYAVAFHRLTVRKR